MNTTNNTIISDDSNVSEELPELVVDEKKFKQVISTFISNSKINIYNYRIYNSSELLDAYAKRFHPELLHWRYNADRISALYNRCIPEVMELCDYHEPNWSSIINSWKTVYKHYNDDEDVYRLDQRTPISAIIFNMIESSILSKYEVYGTDCVESITQFVMWRLKIPVEFTNEVEEFVRFELNYHGIRFGDVDSIQWVKFHNFIHESFY